MSQTVLVTGAAGFIGSHVSQTLAARGDTVVGLDNLNSYYDPARKRENIAEICNEASTQERFTFVEGDIRDRDLIARLFAQNAFTAVAHLGAMGGVRASVEDPYLYYDVNVNGTLVLLDAARVGGPVNFICASTSSAYGKSTEIPFVETDPCNSPLSPYAASKRAAELLAYTFHHLYGQNITVLRFFTVYGPRMRPDLMAYKIANSIVSGIRIPLYNDGQMYRDWTYVDDIVSGVVSAIDRPLGYEIINLGRGEPVLLSDFVRLLERQAGHAPDLEPAPMMEADMSYTCANIEKARALLDYNPQVSVEDGVARFWNWFQDIVLTKNDSQRSDSESA
jgi:UDP-glucuronate 4-epimerase